jgi:hypothetical protein
VSPISRPINDPMQSVLEEMQQCKSVKLVLNWH